MRVHSVGYKSLRSCLRFSKNSEKTLDPNPNLMMKIRNFKTYAFNLLLPSVGSLSSTVLLKYRVAQNSSFYDYKLHSNVSKLLSK